MKLWDEGGSGDSSPGSSFKRIPILFRKTVPEIPSTTYGTFAIYRYPAKFIPQVVAFVLKKYGRRGMKVFDPFAGYGTVGIVSRIYGYDYELWDLNPILSVIHDTAIMKSPRISVLELIREIKNSREEFIPKWSNLYYWFPEEFIPMLLRAWGYAHSLADGDKKRVLLIPLMRVTRFFSYADEKIHKLYKSSYSRRKIEKLLKGDWERCFYELLEKEIVGLLKKISEYNSLHPKEVEYRVRSGIDTLETRLDDDVNILITSPPYLQAQEYIRSTKLDLFWLGYEESYIRELSKKEIPYRPVRRIEIYSEKYHEYREKIVEEHLRTLYDNYFHAVLNALSTLGENVTDYMFIFVGPAKIRTMPIPVDEIIAEHLQELGWRHEATYIDRIVSRVMFETEINPASGEKDSRMKTEHLVVLKRKS